MQQTHTMCKQKNSCNKMNTIHWECSVKRNALCNKFVCNLRPHVIIQNVQAHWKFLLGIVAYTVEIFIIIKCTCASLNLPLFVSFLRSLIPTLNWPTLLQATWEIMTTTYSGNAIFLVLHALIQQCVAIVHYKTRKTDDHEWCMCPNMWILICNF